MSVRSFQGAEVQNLAHEFIGSYTVSNTRDTTIKKNGEASWQLNSSQSQFFRTGYTKPGVDVIAACEFWWRTPNATGVNRQFRICTAGDNGSNTGRWQAVFADISGDGVGKLRIFDKTNTLKATGPDLSFNTWYHFMLMDDGTTAYVYLDEDLTPKVTWVHGEGAWNNKPWGPSSVQIGGKGATILFNFDDVICFDDQDGRMDWITPSDWDGDTSWRVARAKPVTPDVVTGFTPSTAGNHYVLVDDSPNDDTGDYVWALDAHAFSFLAREGSDYTLSVEGGTAGRLWLYDLSPAGNEWTDLIFDGISTGIHDTTDDVKELLNIEDSATIGVAGGEDVRAVDYFNSLFTTGGPIPPNTERRFYVWRDTVLIGPPDPGVPPVTGQRRRGVLV